MQFGYLTGNGTGFFETATTISGIDNWSVSITSTPEPSALLLLSMGLVGLVVSRKRNS